MRNDSGDLTIIVGQVFGPEKPIDYENVRISWRAVAESECSNGYSVVSHGEDLWDVLPYDGSAKLEITGIIRCK